MHVLGLIPARKGSKGIAGKNTVLLDGQPLLVYTCRAALASRRITRVILSTDDPAIAEVGRQHGVEVPFMRPRELALDESPMLGVIQHTLGELRDPGNYRPDVVVLLQPTSPLRTAEHIDEAVDILIRTGAESVVSVVQVPHQFNPVSLMCIHEGRLVPYLAGPTVARRQEKPPVYARNGPAILAVRTEVVVGKNSLYGDDWRPFIMAPEESVDIDDPLDLDFAAFLLARRKLLGEQ